jgi:hypothetical protein
MDAPTRMSELVPRNATGLERIAPSLRYSITPMLRLRLLNQLQRDLLLDLVGKVNVGKAT